MSDKPCAEESETQFASLWQGALDQYAATSGKRLEDGDIPKPSTLQALMAEIDGRHNQFSDFRKWRYGLFKILDMALKPIKLIGNMAAGFASQASTYLTQNH